jgi:hypothetical protein
MWSDSELLAFLNPDKSPIVIIENKEEAAKQLIYRLAETK